MITKEAFERINREFGVDEKDIKATWEYGFARGLHQETSEESLRRGLKLMKEIKKGIFDPNRQGHTCGHKGMHVDELAETIKGMVMQLIPEELAREIHEGVPLTGELLDKYDCSGEQYEASRALSALALATRSGVLIEFMAVLNRWIDRNLVKIKGFHQNEGVFIEGEIEEV